MALVLHGANYVAFKTEGELNGRCRGLARRAFLATSLLTLIVTPAAFVLRPPLLRSFAARAWGGVFPAAGHRWSCSDLVVSDASARRAQSGGFGSGTYLGYRNDSCILGQLGRSGCARRCQRSRWLRSRHVEVVGLQRTAHTKHAHRQDERPDEPYERHETLEPLAGPPVVGS